MAQAALQTRHVTSSRQGVNKNVQLSRFLEHISEFSIFFQEICMVARSYQALVADTESLLERALVSLKTKLQVKIFAIFGGFFAFFKLSVLAQAFHLGQ